jgi:hypothetical protein
MEGVMNSNTDWPSEAEVTRLTTELLANRATAPAEIAVAFLGPLATYLRRQFPYADPDHCEEAAGRAITDTVRGAARYDPTRLDLGRFLRMVARRDLQNLLDKEKRHAAPLVSLEFVEEPPERRKILAEDTSRPNFNDPRIIAERAAFAPSEHAAFELMRAGERNTEVFARAAGLIGTPDELERAVKQLKDRVKIRLRRAVREKS